MTDQQLINELWARGRFRDPDCPEAHNVQKSDLPNLTLADEEVRCVVASYQEDSRPILDEMVRIVHNRPLYANGEVGDATRAFIRSYLRCKCPDFEMTVDDDPEVAKLWNREEANWPDACRRELTFGRNFDALPGLTKDQTDGIYWGIANNWTAAFSDVIVTPVPQRTPPPGVKGWHHTEVMSGGILAWNFLAQNRCDVNLTGAWNRNVNWSSLDMTSATGAHEFGHFLGLNHDSRDSTALMWFSIHAHSRSRFGYVNASDVAAAKALGYKPHSDWESRRPGLDKLFLPRGQQPDPPPPQPDDLEARVSALEFQQRIDAMQFELLRAMIRELRGGS